MDKVFLNNTPGLLSIQQLRITVQKGEKFSIKQEEYQGYEELFKTLIEKKWIIPIEEVPQSENPTIEYSEPSSEAIESTPKADEEKVEGKADEEIESAKSDATDEKDSKRKKR